MVENCDVGSFFISVVCLEKERLVLKQAAPRSVEHVLIG